MYKCPKCKKELVFKYQFRELPPIGYCDVCEEQYMLEDVFNEELQLFVATPVRFYIPYTGSY